MAAVRATRAVLPGMLAAGRGDRDHASAPSTPCLPDPVGRRLQRRQGGAGELLASRCPRSSVRAASASTPSARARSPPTCGWATDGVAAHARPRGRADAPRTSQAAAAPGAATGRFTRPDEVADLVVLLASDRAGQRHRHRLHHRRRPRHHPLTEHAASPGRTTPHARHQDPRRLHPRPLAARHVLAALDRAVRAAPAIAPTAPGWPGVPDTVAEARAHPERIADHGIDDVVDHYARVIADLPEPSRSSSATPSAA